MTAAELSAEEQHTLTVLSQVFSTFSVCGSALIIASYFLFPNLRKFSYKLVLWLSFSDLLNQAMSYFGNPSHRVIACDLQAFGMQFFSVASFLWTGAIAFVLRSTVISKRSDIESKYRAMHGCIWSAALFTAVLPSWKFGPTGAWCWISADNLTGKILRFVCYYFPLWVTIGYNSYAYISVIRFLRRVQMLANSIHSDDSREPRFEMKAISRLGWYPSILIATHVFGTVNRIQNWVAPESPIFFLFVMHTITSSSMGFLNCVAYGLNTSVRMAWCEKVPFLNRVFFPKAAAGANKFHKFENELGTSVPNSPALDSNESNKRESAMGTKSVAVVQMESIERNDSNNSI